MKTLTTDQINYIEDILISRYKIKYQDTRDEVLDHIACEVEGLISGDYEFNDALDTILKKWHSRLLLEYFGIFKDIPKFIAQPITKIIAHTNWRVYLLTSLVSITFTVFLSLQKVNAITAFITLLVLTILVATISLRNTKKLNGYYLDIYKRLLVMEISLSILLFVLMTFLDNLLQLNYTSLDCVVMLHFIITWYHIYLFRNLIKIGQLIPN